MKVPDKQGYADGKRHGDEDVLRCVAAQIHPGEAHQKKSEDKDAPEEKRLCLKCQGEIKRRCSLGVAAGEGISGGGGDGAFNRRKSRVENPRPWDAESDLEGLDAKPCGKVGKAEKIGKTLIRAPVQCADDGDDDNLLPEISGKLHKLVKDRGSDVVKKP